MSLIVEGPAISHPVERKEITDPATLRVLADYDIRIDDYWTRIDIYVGGHQFNCTIASSAPNRMPSGVKMGEDMHQYGCPMLPKPQHLEGVSLMVSKSELAKAFREFADKLDPG